MISKFIIMVFVAAIAFALAACKPSFDKLDPQVATHALAACYAYHFEAKKDMDSMHDKFQPYFSYSNVRANFQSEAEDWLMRYMMGDKKILLKEAKEACNLAGLPY